jgi:hypothetical protein
MNYTTNSILCQEIRIYSARKICLR